MLFQDLGLTDLFARLAALVVGLTVHEYAHAYVAYRLGDTTAAEQGRLTLNPLSHIDPIGALMLMVAGFGWARPVPVDPYRLDQRGMVWVALAGPVSNICLAVVTVLALRGAVASGLLQAVAFIPALNALLDFVILFIGLNIALAVFNMFPIAPLDGWRVLEGLAPRSWATRLMELEAYGPMILLVLIAASRLGGVSVFGWVINSAVELFWRAFGAGMIA